MQCLKFTSHAPIGCALPKQGSDQRRRKTTGSITVDVNKPPEW